MTFADSSPSTRPSAVTLSSPRRLVIGVTSVLSLGVVAGACGSDVDTTATAPIDSPATSVVSGPDGAEARAAQAAARPVVAESASLPAASSMAADSVSGMCIGEPYVPSAEEIALANADTDALVATLVTYGVAHEVVTDDLGFSYVQTDYSDVVAQSVVDSFWQNRYPVDDVGIDVIDIDEYEPVAPSAGELAAMAADNDKLAAGFDRAGIAFTRVSDELGWEWIEWDYDDESIQEAVMAVFDEVYGLGIAIDPPEELPCDEMVAIDDVMIDDVVVDDAVVSGPVDAPPVDVAEPAPADAIVETSELRPDDLVIVEEEFSAEQVAERDAEVAAMDAGFTEVNVEHTVYGESPWASVVFDIDNDSAVGVVEGILAARG